MIIFGFLPKSPEMMAVAVAFSMVWLEPGVEPRPEDDRARERLAAFRLGSAVDVATWSVNLAVDVRECAVGWADGVYLGVQGRSCQGSTAGVSW
jgi:hypothetical protein